MSEFQIICNYSGMTCDDYKKCKHHGCARLYEFVAEQNARLAMRDNVNRPAHYTAHPSGVECIEITRHMNYNKGVALAYIWRAGIKDPNKEIEDLRKAIWHLQDEIKRLENEPQTAR